MKALHKRHLCTVPKCVKFARVPYRFCQRHGGGPRCARKNCKTKAIDTLCRKHGGGKRCELSDCTKAAFSGGRCFRHRVK